MSRSNKTPTKHYIGRDAPVIEVSVEKPMHWYPAWLLGYRAKAWPKKEADCDDIRYDLKEKEYDN